MSNWTHVAGIIRVDLIRWEGDEKIDFIKELGKSCIYSDSDEIWEEFEEYPERFLPSGSEGTLQMSVWENPSKNHVAAYTVSIFGDLRDHDSCDEIIEWFKKQCEKFWVRNAIITVENEWNGTKNWVYSDNKS